MRFYRQHPIVLLFALIETGVIATLGVVLTLVFQQFLFLVLILLAALLATRRYLVWSTLSVYVEGRQVTIRTLDGFVVNERVVSLNAPGGLRLRQNLSGILFDYGMLRIELFGSPVQIRYIAPFSALRQQIDHH